MHACMAMSLHADAAEWAAHTAGQAGLHSSKRSFTCIHTDRKMHHSPRQPLAWPGRQRADTLHGMLMPQPLHPSEAHAGRCSAEGGLCAVEQAQRRQRHRRQLPRLHTSHGAEYSGARRDAGCIWGVRVQCTVSQETFHSHEIRIHPSATLSVGAEQTRLAVRLDMAWCKYGSTWDMLLHQQRGIRATGAHAKRVQL